MTFNPRSRPTVNVTRVKVDDEGHVWSMWDGDAMTRRLGVVLRLWRRGPAVEVRWRSNPGVVVVLTRLI